MDNRVVRGAGGYTSVNAGSHSDCGLYPLTEGPLCRVHKDSQIFVGKAVQVPAFVLYVTGFEGKRSVQLDLTFNREVVQDRQLFE